MAVVSNDEVLEARKTEVLALPTFADTTGLKPAAEEVNMFLVPSPRGVAAETFVTEMRAASGSGRSVSGLVGTSVLHEYAPLYCSGT